MYSMEVGLRIDVDTFRGTKCGVPRLCQVLGDHDIAASFFFSVGPDNMGRHLLRLVRPRFLEKMLRSKAASLYGWQILLRGTLWPGPVIGERLGNIIRATSDSGHEIGLHAWDHYAWQAHIDDMDGGDVHLCLEKGVNMLTHILGHPPTCSAVPGWKCSDLVLMEKTRFPFRYNSDCRGKSLFYPLVDGKELPQPQIPVTLPTYDEVIGRKGITDSIYNDYMLSLLTADKLNVLTIHAEVEGISLVSMFEKFLKAAQRRGVSFLPLGSLFSAGMPVGRGVISAREIPGREGWVSCQEESEGPRKDHGV